MSDQKLEFGPQPLGDVIEELKLKNHDLVDASATGLTHKQVQKGRKGRRLTRNVQMKIQAALNEVSGRNYSLTDLFNYR